MGARIYYAPALIGGALSDAYCLTADVCLSDFLSDIYLSVAYVGPKSRTERA